MAWRVITGDCIEAMRDMDAASVDAIVTDPPYGLEFMGKEWDRLSDDAVSRSWDTKGRTMTDAPERDPDSPGGRHGASVSVSPNPRCTMCGRTKNGRDTVKGFKVCHCEDPTFYMPAVASEKMQRWHGRWAAEAFRVLKPGAHLLAFGGTRTFHRLTCALEDAGFEIRDCLSWLYGSGFPKSLNLDGEWKGWGTALKPAHEPIVLARKPLGEPNVAANVRRWGTGALNIDGTRIGTEVETWPATRSYSRHDTGSPSKGTQLTGDGPVGRWPANVVLDEEAAVALDEQTGETRSRIGTPRAGRNGDGWGMTATGAEYDDQGGASRFFYVPKADREERNRGLAHLPMASVHPPSGDDCAWDIPDSRSGPRQNYHPTVKPIALMAWLCRLITPPGGTVLDPFMGSGSTGIAALREGFGFVGIEREPDYVEIARARIQGDAPLFNVGSEVGG